MLPRRHAPSGGALTIGAAVGGSGAVTRSSGLPRLLAGGLHYTTLRFFLYTTTLLKSYTSFKGQTGSHRFISCLLLTPWSHSAVRSPTFHTVDRAALGRRGLEPLTSGATTPVPGGVYTPSTVERSTVPTTPSTGSGLGRVRAAWPRTADQRGHAARGGGGSRAARGRCHCLGAVSTVAVGSGPFSPAAAAWGRWRWLGGGGGGGGGGQVVPGAGLRTRHSLAPGGECMGRAASPATRRASWAALHAGTARAAVTCRKSLCFLCPNPYPFPTGFSENTRVYAPGLGTIAVKMLRINPDPKKNARDIFSSRSGYRLGFIRRPLGKSLGIFPLAAREIACRACSVVGRVLPPADANLLFDYLVTVAKALRYHKAVWLTPVSIAR